MKTNGGGFNFSGRRIVTFKLSHVEGNDYVLAGKYCTKILLRRGHVKEKVQNDRSLTLLS